MNTKTVRELRSIAKDKGLHGYYKLKKDNLVALLLEQSAEGKKACTFRKIIPSPQEMDEFEKEEVEKGRPVIKNRLNE